MEEALLQLLKQLEAIGDAHEELFDTEVREAMSEPIFFGYLKPDPSYTVPHKFGMYSPEADALIFDAISAFLAAAASIGNSGKASTFHQRLAAFQNERVTISGGRGFDEFFGWANPAQFDASGNAK